MTKQNKWVSEITARDEDFSQWYTDVVRKAELIDYSPVRGCMVLRPYGYAIWENIQRELDKRLKATGHENVAMPLFIPESLLQMEKDHVEGFAPEVAWVTHGGENRLQERLCIRPTSEVSFCHHYAKVIQSWRDLPKLYNQWCSVVRWEKTTRPFLRTTEFFWQEGHTAHATGEEAKAETLAILDLYEDFYRECLAIPVLRGLKTEREKFAGAVHTYTVEAMMHDGKALQGGTTHYFGDGFAKAFGIQFSDKNNELQHVHQSSWGVSTRMIGGIIMVHGDQDGLIMPPRIAPIQAVIIPIAAKKAGVLEACQEIKERLSKEFRVSLDESDKQPGWKFAEQEMRGIPLRIELGPRDLEAGSCLVVRRDTREKIAVPLDALQEELPKLLDAMHQAMYEKAEKAMASRIYETDEPESFAKFLQEKPGFVRAPWCGSEACEEQVKESYQASSRCIAEDEKPEGKCCVICQKEAAHEVYWGKAY